MIVGGNEMRTESEVLQQIKAFAMENDDIKVVAMNGSRVNPMIPEDSFKDYDLVFFVEKLEPYQSQKKWLTTFGDILILCEPEIDGLGEPLFADKEGYIFLVIFTDGIRMDIQLRPVSLLASYLKEDSLTKIIVDKEQRVPLKPVPNDFNYHVQRPSEELYQASCNEFWWQVLNVLKAYHRDELLVAVYYLNMTRSELIRMLSWQVGIETDFSLSLGKEHHLLQRYLPKKEWKKLLSSFDTTSREALYESLLIIRTLFKEALQTVGNSLNYSVEDGELMVEKFLEAHGKNQNF